MGKCSDMEVPAEHSMDVQRFVGDDGKEAAACRGGVENAFCVHSVAVSSIAVNSNIGTTISMLRLKFWLYLR